MKIKKVDKEDVSNEDEETSSNNIFYSIVKKHWLAFVFALIITVITVITVPILYKVARSHQHNTTTIFAWYISADSILNQTFIFNRTNLQLGIVSSLMFDKRDNLYIVDKTYNRILKFDIHSNALTLIAGHTNGTNGSDPTSLNSPNDIYIGSPESSYRIYIADTLNHRIQLWDEETKRGQTVFGTGQAGNGKDQLNTPMSLTMDETSNIIYIADYKNNRIVSLNLDKQVSEVFLALNNNLERHQYISTPISITYSLTNTSLIIAQEYGYNVVRWDMISPSWTLIAGSVSSELNGTSRTLFNRLCFATTDDDGNTYVVDCDNQRVQFFKGDGSKGKTIAGVIQAKGNNSYIFNLPTAIAFDSEDNIYVADSQNYRIQRFKHL